jgi:hypothetical protein
MTESTWMTGKTGRKEKPPGSSYCLAGDFLKVLYMGLELSLTENAVHLGATYWADALCHATTGL